MTREINAHTKLKGMEQSYKIVLIDDDPISHLITSRMIQQFTSSKIETFVDPVEALAQLTLRATHEPGAFPDLILLDIDMPRMNGWQFLEEFQKLPQHILQRTSVMMLTSSNHVADVERSKQFSSVRNFFSKPLTREMIKMITMSQN
jgi:CheY-like chemotaxis protein